MFLQDVHVPLLEVWLKKYTFGFNMVDLVLSLEMKHVAPIISIWFSGQMETGRDPEQ